MNDLPWSQLFGLLFSTMGPIRAVAVFGQVGTDDADPAVRRLADKASLLCAGAFLVTLFVAPGSLASMGVSFPVLVGASGVILLALSLQALLVPAHGGGAPLDPARVPAAAIAFPGLFPPIAVSIPLIFDVAFEGFAVTLGIGAMDLGLIAVNWFLMRRSKAILRATGPVPLQLFGAVFGVVQVALALQFILSAVQML